MNITQRTQDRPLLQSGSAAGLNSQSQQENKNWQRQDAPGFPRIREHARVMGSHLSQAVNLESEVKAACDMEALGAVGPFTGFDGAARLLDGMTNAVQSSITNVVFTPKDGLHSVEDAACPSHSAVSIIGQHGREPMHANRITLPGLEKAHIIAAQQPEGTSKGRQNFSKLIYQQTDVVFDLRTHSEVIGENAKFDYLPNREKSECSHKDFKINLLSKFVLTDQMQKLKVRLSKVSFFRTTESREIECIQQREWKSGGVIEKQRLRRLNNKFLKSVNRNRNILVHDRAGVGRTGTLLAYVSLYQQLCANLEGRKITESNLLTSLVKTVYQLRQQRGPMAVQNEEQLRLIYETIKEDLISHDRFAASNGNAPVDVNSLRKEVSLGERGLRELDNLVAQAQAEADAKLKAVNTKRGPNEDAKRLSKTESTLKIVSSDGWQSVNLESIARERAPIFQFISKNGFKIPHIKTEKLNNIVQQLQQQTGRSNPADQDYAIKSIDTIASDRPDVETLKLTLSNGDAKKDITIVVILAGYVFSQGFLERQDLLHAYETLLKHMPDDRPGHARPQPVLLSKAGIGRAAALMVVDEIMTRHNSTPFESKQALLSEIDEIITTGRRDRSPNFIHNQAQRNALIEALLELTGFKS